MHINNTDIKKIETWSDQVFEECTQSFSVDAEQQNKIERMKETKKCETNHILCSRQYLTTSRKNCSLRFQGYENG